jgi:hypothetical protein
MMRRVRALDALLTRGMHPNSIRVLGHGTGNPPRLWRRLTPALLQEPERSRFDTSDAM